MALWLWLKGIPGPPANDEWFELLSYRLGAGGVSGTGYGGSTGGGVEPQPKVLTVCVPYDSRSSQFFQALANGQLMEHANVFFEPQTQLIFTKCMFSSVSSGSGKEAPLYATLMYESWTVDRGT